MSEWTEESLGRLASIEIGGTPSRDVPAFWASENAEGFPWASIADLGPRFVSATKERITRLGVLSSNVKPVKNGTLMMSFKLTIGRAGIAACDLFTNEAIAAFVPAPQTLDGNFLYYLLPPIARNAVTDVAIKGSTLNKQTLSKLKLRFPKDMRQQRRIAEILSTLDEAIEQTEALIAKHQQIKAGLMHDLFTRGVTPDGHLRPTREQAPDLYKESPLGWIPKEWEVKSLQQVATYQHGRPFPSSDYSDEGVLLLRPGNLHISGIVRWGTSHTTRIPEQWLRECPEYVLKAGDIVMNLTAQSLDDQFLGRVCIVEATEPALLNQRIARFHALQAEHDFLYWLLRSSQFRNQIERTTQGTKVQHIYNSDLNRVVLAIPGTRWEQKRIAAALQLISELLAGREADAYKLRQQKHGLMHDLLTGRVRIPAVKAKEVSTIVHAPSDLEPNT